MLQAIEAAQPAHCISMYLPELPRGKLVAIGAGKASAAMAKVVEAYWPGEVSGLVVTRYGYAALASALELSKPALSRSTMSLMSLVCIAHV